MTISQFIIILQIMKEKHGDLPVYIAKEICERESSGIRHYPEFEDDLLGEDLPERLFIK